MEQEKLNQILKDHKEWLNDSNKGRRADLQDADLQGADLQGANLRGADLQDAYLRGADLQGASLQRANLRGAYLQDAYLQRAYLRGAYLRGADLQGASLQGADLRDADGIIRIESQYPYQTYGYYCKNQKRVRLGCFDRTVEGWDSDFWNNDREFPENSPHGKNRFMIYTFIKEWLIENEK